MLESCSCFPLKTREVISPLLDILADEGEKFVKRIREEGSGLGLSVSWAQYSIDCMHGWTHFPRFVLSKEAARMKDDALDTGIRAIKEAIHGE